MAVRPRSADVRADLLHHAARAFEHEGYVKASLARIAADAGYTKGAVYSGFGGKPQLFAEVCATEFERITTEAMRGVAAALVEEGVGREELTRRLAEALGSTVLNASGQWPVLVHEFQAVALRDDVVGAEYAAFSERRRAFLVELLENHERFASADHAELTRMAALLLMLVHTVAVERHLRPDEVDRETVLTSIETVIEALLP
ncbi:TetR/AcrR family transcriptional regulator [Micrococcus sp. EYE_162]|uniref:TetR/AcrR family transcriptional regulator n=1 Tax=Micrococcus TaxID=1269 RepID=UPI002002E789|nr:MULTISPECIES: TetR family transcriptional regulator [unclassified Micrococcus]MCK6095069.1 TetR/AcrR family transcriptional regulator [Micrococcus sp. EYE_212]MCK6171016.1 TetR/AcrR family transcriptional regulator [Micrococcus sp. EYE_162]